MTLTKTLNSLIIAVLLTTSSAAFALPAGMMGSVALGNRSGDVRISQDGDSISGSTDNDAQYLGVKIGYANIVNQNLGYIFRGALNTKISGSGWASFTELRPEANLAFGFNDLVYAFAGVNLSFYLSGFEDWGMGRGVQLGAGFVVNPQTTIEFQYIATNHDFNDNGTSVDVTLKSLELSVGYAF